MSPPRTVTALVLAHLAASPLFACGGVQHSSRPPPAPEPTASEAQTPPASASLPSAADASTTPAASAAPSASASSSAPAVASASPSASAAPEPPMKPTGGTCWTAAQCPKGMRCVLPFNGAQTIKGKPGTCYDNRAAIPGGRPLYVDGIAHVAHTHTREDARGWLDQAALSSPSLDALDDTTRSVLAARLRRDALDEHASIAAFARTLCQLLALGAPAWLVESTHRALADEIVHAKQMLAWCHRLGEPVSPGSFPQAVAPFDGFAEGPLRLAEVLLRDVVRGGCIGETLAAHDLATCAATAPLPELRDLFTTTASDEARHAALAYETAIWLVMTFPELAQALVAERDLALSERSAAERELLAPLFERVALQTLEALQALVPPRPCNDLAEV